MQRILSPERPILLIGIKGGGCNGLKYIVESIERAGSMDETFAQDEVNIAVCGKSLMYLLGTHIAMKHDVMGSRIEFQNPNANSNCGCGETFGV